MLKRVHLNANSSISVSKSPEETLSLINNQMEMLDWNFIPNGDVDPSNMLGNASKSSLSNGPEHRKYASYDFQ